MWRVVKLLMPRSRKILKRKDRFRSEKYSPYVAVPTLFCTVASIPKMASGLIKRFKAIIRKRLDRNFFCMRQVNAKVDY